MQVTLLAWARNGSGELFVRLPHSGTRRIGLNRCTINAEDHFVPAYLAVQLKQRLELSGLCELVVVAGRSYTYAIKQSRRTTGDWHPVQRILDDAKKPEAQRRYAPQTIVAVVALERHVRQFAV